MKLFSIVKAQHAALIPGLAAILLLSSTGTSAANPKDIPPGAHKVYQFNVIGYPAGQTYDGGCGNGNRMFVNRDAHSAHVLVTNGTSWDVSDCNATSDNWGEITTSDVGKYGIFVRILGAPSGNLRICADTYEDFMAGETLCLLGVIDLTRNTGQSKFQLAPSAMFDASLSDLVWTVDTNAEFRIAQFRVYEMP